jgi:hypothetical protein
MTTPDPAAGAAEGPAFAAQLLDALKRPDVRGAVAAVITHDSFADHVQRALLEPVVGDAVAAAVEASDRRRSPTETPDIPGMARRG